jgi:hypothetical protein
LQTAAGCKPFQFLGGELGSSEVKQSCEEQVPNPYPAAGSEGNGLGDGGCFCKLVRLSLDPQTWTGPELGKGLLFSGLYYLTAQISPRSLFARMLVPQSGKGAPITAWSQAHKLCWAWNLRWDLQGFYTFLYS